MRKSPNLNIVFIFVLISLSTRLIAQIEVHGNNYLEYSIDNKNDKNYFEDWLEVWIGYENWRIGARYEIHEPPQPFSQDTVGHGLAQRFVEYKTNNLTITAGNYYALFGRGLTLRSFENRNVRWDTNLDGGKIEYTNEYFDFQALAGKPRDRTGIRHEWLYGGALTFKPIDMLQVGGTFVYTDLETRGEISWGSALVSADFDWGDIYIERAFKNYPNQYPKGDAIYIGSNLFISDFAALLEYRIYDQFDLTEGLTYNNPPTVFREHLYTLLNRHQRVQDARDEQGYQFEVSYSYDDLGIALFNTSQTKNKNGQVLYQEFYGQVDIDPSYELNIVLAGGMQEDLEADYINLVGSAKWAFLDEHAIHGLVEHQHTIISFNNRQYHTQLYTLSYDLFSDYTVSLIAETTTDQLEEKDHWLAAQFDARLPLNSDLTVFAGARRKGKICAGGVCINRPEFEGVEFRLNTRF